MQLYRKAAVTALLLLCVSATEAQSWRYQRQYQHRHAPAPKPPPPPVSIPSPSPSPVPQPAPPPVSSISVADQIAVDMSGLNEGHPHGVLLSWDFANGPSFQMMNNPGSNTAAVLWGALYVDANGSPATNTRVAIRSCQIWWKQASTGTWMLGEKDVAPQVDLYAEDFSAQYGSANTRTEPDGSLSTVTSAGRVAHFYPPRVSFTPNNLGGWVSLCEMRLVLNNPAGPDDRASAHLLASIGADYYPSLTSPGIENNPAIAGGKFKYVGNDWRSFAMTTLSQAQLESNPPPIDLTGILP